MFDKVKMNLEKNGFQVSCFKTAEDAAAYLDQKIDGSTVGFGGSGTLQKLGIYEKLKSHNRVFWHWKKEDQPENCDIFREAQTADVYLSSVNGLAETGEIINIDGVGNRVAATLYGHRKVYLVAGRNKLAADFSAALYRARNIAAPLNARRLNKKTPCVATGRCMDCSSPDRICRELSVLLRCPLGGDYEIVLIDEELGF